MNLQLKIITLLAAYRGWVEVENNLNFLFIMTTDKNLYYLPFRRSYANSDDLARCRMTCEDSVVSILKRCTVFYKPYESVFVSVPAAHIVKIDAYADPHGCYIQASMMPFS